MDVLISGAGVGGLALAAGLVADGHQVRVLEADPGLRESGAAVTIYGNGAAALARLGAHLPDGIGGRIDRLEIRDRHGRPATRFDMTAMQARTGFPVTTVSRKALIAHLAAVAGANVIGFDRAVRSAAVDGESVTVTDARGDTHTAGVLVGADGVRSAVREQLLGGPPATANGWTTWQGLTRIVPSIASGSTGVLIVGAAGLVGMMPAGGGSLQWWFDVNEPRPPIDVIGWLRGRFRDYPDPVGELLVGIAEPDIGTFAHMIHEVPQAWGIGPATLVGDAAHAFPASQAQGANQALEDAWVLREALRGPGFTIERLRRYERLRARRVRRVSKLAASERTNRPAHPVVNALARLVPPAAAGRAYTSLIRRSSSVLNDER
jgi:FAD-dependent urate hydroxylase